MDLTDSERAEIARLISEGFTSGLLDADDTRTTWSLEYAKGEHR